MGSEVLLEQVQYGFSFRNKFIILPCGLLVDNNTFSKTCVFKLITLIMVIMKTKMRIFNNNKIKGNEELILVIFNCTFLFDQNDGWTVPCRCLMVCCKNIYLRMLFFKKAYIAW